MQEEVTVAQGEMNAQLEALRTELDAERQAWRREIAAERGRTWLYVALAGGVGFLVGR
jgi:putative heme degradation protein